MNEKKIDESSLKSKGFLPQRQENMVSMRIKATGGRVDAEKLRAIADVAKKYGHGYIHITSRQGIEIPFVKLEEAEEASSELQKQGVLKGSAGKRVRAVVACTGNKVCRYGLIDCQHIAYRIDEKYFGEAVPKQLKIAVTGCPSACVKSQDTDFGVMGTTKPQIISENCVGCKRCEKACIMEAIKVLEDKAIIDKEKCILCGVCIAACKKDALRTENTGCTIFVGGKMGRKPRHGTKLLEFVEEEQLLSILEKSIEFYRKEGLDGERFGDLLERLGIEKYRKEVL